MSKLNKGTKLVLLSPYLWSALIAVLTSAIVSLMSVNINWWIASSIFMLLFAIVLLAIILHTSQVFESMKHKLINISQPEDLIDDAFQQTVWSLKGMKKKDKVIDTEQTKMDNNALSENLNLMAVIMVFCVFISLFFAVQGVKSRNRLEKARVNEENRINMEMLLEEYEKRSAERELRLEEKIDELSTTISTMQESMDALENSVKSSRK